MEGAKDDITKFLEIKVNPAGVDGEVCLGEYLRSVAGEPRGYAQFVLELPLVATSPCK